MEDEGIPMIKLAAFFINEPLSLDGLFMLGDSDPMTIDQVCKKFIGDIRKNVNVTRLLDKLK